MYGVTRIEAFAQDVALVSFKKIPAKASLLADIFRHYADSRINLDMISQTSPISDRVSISFTCFSTDLVAVLEISNALQAEYPALQLSPMVSSGNCKIYLYGEEMRMTPGVFARAMDALGETGAEPQLITTSEVDISLLVTEAHLEEAVAALRAAFGLTE